MPCAPARWPRPQMSQWPAAGCPDAATLRAFVNNKANAKKMAYFGFYSDGNRIWLGTDHGKNVFNPKTPFDIPKDVQPFVIRWNISDTPAGGQPINANYALDYDAKRDGPYAVSAFAINQCFTDNLGNYGTCDQPVFGRRPGTTTASTARRSSWPRIRIRSTSGTKTHREGCRSLRLQPGSGAERQKPRRSQGGPSPDHRSTGKERRRQLDRQLVSKNAGRRVFCSPPSTRAFSIGPAILAQIAPRFRSVGKARHETRQSLPSVANLSTLAYSAPPENHIHAPGIRVALGIRLLGADDQVV